MYAPSLWPKRASRSAGRSPCFEAPCIGFLFISPQLRSVLPLHASSPPRSCTSLRSSWPTHGRTCTSKTAPMLGAPLATLEASRRKVALSATTLSRRSERQRKTQCKQPNNQPPCGGGWFFIGLCARSRVNFLVPGARLAVPGPGELVPRVRDRPRMSPAERRSSRGGFYAIRDLRGGRRGRAVAYAGLGFSSAGLTGAERLPKSTSEKSSATLGCLRNACLPHARISRSASST